ncbi:unnamed protein product [Ectocarpus sp. 4 AP-2014]
MTRKINNDNCTRRPYIGNNEGKRGDRSITVHTQSSENARNTRSRNRACASKSIIIMDRGARSDLYIITFPAVSKAHGTQQQLNDPQKQSTTFRESKKTSPQGLLTRSIFQTTGQQEEW